MLETSTMRNKALEDLMGLSGPGKLPVLKLNLERWPWPPTPNPQPRALVSSTWRFRTRQKTQL